MAEISANESVTARFEKYFELPTVHARLSELARRFPEEKSFELDVGDLARFETSLADELIEHPDVYLASAQNALARGGFITVSGAEFRPYVRPTNLPEGARPMVYNLGAPHLDHLVSVEGVISSISEIKPRLVNAVWKCIHCGEMSRTVPDKVVPIAQPGTCPCGRRDFILLEDQSTFLNYQRAQMQDPVERMRGNMPAVHVDLWLEDDLVNTVAPGDKVFNSGMLRLRPNLQDRKKISVYSKFLDVAHIHEIELDFEELEVSPEEQKEILALSKDPKLFEKIVASVAPSIYGHDELKLAIALQLFGGTHGKVLPDGEHIRNDIHILLCGDPSVGKSTILEYVRTIAPKCVMVSGGSSSGVGLCVAPDSLILNDAGLKPISSFVEENWNGASKEEIPGAFSQAFAGNAWTLGDDLKIAQGTISKIWRIRAPPEMIQITTRMGREISLTPATPLIVFDGVPSWKPSMQLRVGQFLATARTLPPGDSRTPGINSILGCPNVYLQADLSEFFMRVTNILAQKHGSLRNLVKIYGIDEDSLYGNRSQKYWSNVKLSLIMRMAKDAGLEGEALAILSRGPCTVFLRYGHTTRIPPFLEDGKLAYLAGLLLGDGDCRLSSNAAFLRFSNTSEELLAIFERSVKELFGITARRDKESWRIPSIRFGSVPAYLVLNEFGLVPKKTDLSISHAALCMPNDVLAALLRGLFDTDGYVSVSNTGSPHIGFSTISPQLAKTVQLALLKFGVLAKLRVRRKAGITAKGKNITITSRHDAHVVEIRGVENFKAFSKGIGFSLSRKQERLEGLLTSTVHNTNIDIVPLNSALLRSFPWGYRSGRTRPSRAMLSRLEEKIHDPLISALAHADVFWDEITSIKHFAPTYEWVYDFSVENTHNFICNGFFTHNTASAEKDEISEGWVLKAGAMVLANGGMVAIDEVDKMKEEDRGAMHQAMEQQRISVAKAGIVTEFQSRTSVLAAANPKLGRFDMNLPLASQINLSPPLLSRFDLIFTMRDVLDESKDRKMAHHILSGHMAAAQHLKPESDGGPNPLSPPIAADLLRKYIAYARRNVAPLISKAAAEKIEGYYVDLRKLGKDQNNTFPITSRQIEGIIRLAEASAKLRMSPTVELFDAENALRLEDFVLHEVFVDRETGKLDSDVVSIGQPKSKVDKIRTLLGLISSLEKQVDLVSIDDVVKESASYGMDETYTRRLIDDLKRQGDLYEPRPGSIKTARGPEA